VSCRSSNAKPFSLSFLLFSVLVAFTLTKDTYDLQKELESWLGKPGKLVVAGIGSPIRKDDFVGVKIVQDLKGRVPENVSLIECETVPESFMDEIAEFKPTHVLLVDAALMQLKPGEVRLFDAEKVKSFPAISTHMLPLRVFCEYIKKMSGAKIALLLIEPRNTEFGEGLTREIQETAATVTSTIIKLLATAYFSPECST
jgi:hydrogenase 3 maturation protease